jgi:fermentation-respiration switch protein FrsA (DUF1100 family)
MAPKCGDRGGEPVLRTAATTALVLLAVVAVVVALAWGFQRRLIYLPTGGTVPAVEAVLPGGVEVVLRTEDGLELRAWSMRAAPGASTVLVAPGNAGSRADRAPLARALVAAGFGVLLLEYRGYGGNPGAPTEEGLAADARAAHAYLVAELGTAPERVLLLGESLGAAVATRLAVERPVGGVVLRSPFTSLADVAALHYPLLPVRVLLWDRFDVVSVVGQVRAPMVVVAGADDEIVPAGQSRAVAAAAGARYVEVPGARHNDPALGNGPELVAAVVAVSAT